MYTTQKFQVASDLYTFQQNTKTVSTKDQRKISQRVNNKYHPVSTMSALSLKEIATPLTFVVVAILLYTAVKTIKETFTVHNLKPLPLYKSCKKTRHTDVDKLTMQTFGLKPTHQPEDPWAVYLPCGYTDAQQEMQENKEKFNSLGKNQLVAMIDGMDHLAAKNALWTALKNKYGRLRAQLYMPETWSVFDGDDVKHFEKAQKSGTFIYKANRQRQEGLKLVRTPDIQEAKQGGFVVVQRIQENPYLIEGRKVNLRVYVLIRCQGQDLKAYTYTNGFCYYTPDVYQPMSLDPKRMITTGYIDRNVYVHNPLSLQDFLGHLERKHGEGTAHQFWENAKYLVKGVIEASKDALCNCTQGSQAAFTQIFGVDLTVDATLQESKILEWNKGPSLAFMDDRDKEIKLKMNKDAYAVGMYGDSALDDPSNGFQRVYP